MTRRHDQAGVDLGHAFADPELLTAALTHPSWANERGGADYERLEFLGDAVLQLAVSGWLVERLPTASEGDLTRARQRLVQEAALAEVGRELGLGAALRIGTGAEREGARARPSVLAAVVEAILGAVYRDGGWVPAERLVRTWLASAVDRIGTDGIGSDPKSALQKQVQAELGITPAYDVVAVDGPPHARTFAVEVRVGDRVLGHGTGTSRQRAEQMAASDALARPERSP